ncbi:MAG: translation initiation factor IF-6 [Candidatus Micrarchaeota archaeon]|nr:translation initiation factor IF-6 [Candidatus Micrarchaeota archaeon]MDE1823898.1 translation initiation factor IF-6 [Candidatus Micrarchaeota archaeon]MDE1849312.1 translation initiation factor IF-6 [Candidatus Micrarchaeota archaeon]
MSIVKGSILGNSYIGAFATTNDRFTILSNAATMNEEKMVEEALGTEVARATVNGSGLVGVYTVANSNAIMVPEIMERHEIDMVKRAFPSIGVHVIRTSLNALKNNILANDRIAVINPEYSNKEEKEISDALGVETIRLSVGGFGTVGANNIITNKGLVLNNRASDEESERLKHLFKSISYSTANLGAASIGLCAIANSKGIVVGEDTTGFELARISEGLDLE